MKWLCLQRGPADPSPAFAHTLSLPHLPSLYRGCTDLPAAPRTHGAFSYLRASARDVSPWNFLRVSSWPAASLCSVLCANATWSERPFQTTLCERANPCLSPSSLLWVISLPGICCHLPVVWVCGAAHRMTEVAHEPQELRGTAVNSVLCPQGMKGNDQDGGSSPLGESEGGLFANETERTIIRWRDSKGKGIPPPRGAESLWFGGSHWVSRKCQGCPGCKDSGCLGGEGGASHRKGRWGPQPLLGRVRVYIR